MYWINKIKSSRYIKLTDFYFALSNGNSLVGVFLQYMTRFVGPNLNWLWFFSFCPVQKIHLYYILKNMLCLGRYLENNKWSVVIIKGEVLSIIQMVIQREKRVEFRKIVKILCTSYSIMIVNYLASQIKFMYLLLVSFHVYNIFVFIFNFVLWV